MEKLIRETMLPYRVVFVTPEFRFGSTRSFSLRSRGLIYKLYQLLWSKEINTRNKYEIFRTHATLFIILGHFRHARRRRAAVSK